MSDEEFAMRLIEKRNRQRLIDRGVRNDPVQKMKDEFRDPDTKRYVPRKKKCRKR